MSETDEKNALLGMLSTMTVENLTSETGEKYALYRKLFTMTVEKY